MAMCIASALSADSPCHDDRLPPELCTTEARSDFGMVATDVVEKIPEAMRL